MNTDQNRNFSYGERRQFSAIERYAIGLRLQVVVDALQQLQQAHPGEALRVLELGCGYRGNNLAYLKARYPEMDFTGVDLTIDEALLGQPGITLLAADLNDWQPEDEYDCVLSLAVAEHLLDLPKHFQLITECLAAGGVAILTSPTPPAHAVLSLLAWLNIFDKEEIQDHKLYLTGEGISALAGDAGLGVQTYRTFSLAMNQVAFLAHKE
jgi:trans-aconitate methyltransferase